MSLATSSRPAHITSDKPILKTVGALRDWRIPPESWPKADILGTNPVSVSALAMMY
jgi:hypothetical protein